MCSQTVNITFVGNPNAGKTTLLQTYLQGKFTPSELSTVGCQQFNREHNSTKFVVSLK